MTILVEGAGSSLMGAGGGWKSFELIWWPEFKAWVGMRTMSI
jgi:hypothetical protein